MRQKFTLSLFLLIISAVFGGAKAQNLVITTQSGTEEIRTLSNLQSFQFSSGNLLVNYLSGPTETFAISNISKLSFSGITTGTEISNQTANSTLNIFPNPASATIHIQNVQETGTVLSVFSLNGVLIFNRTMEQGNNSVDVSGLKSGMYIIRINNQAFKLMKQ